MQRYHVDDRGEFTLELEEADRLRHDDDVWVVWKYELDRLREVARDLRAAKSISYVQQRLDDLDDILEA